MPVTTSAGPVALCGVCGKEGALACPSCQSVFYCSEEHNQQNTAEHTAACRSYEVRRNDLYGRYLVAAHDLAPGDLIIRERAYVFGPKQNSTPVCLGCTCLLESDDYRCSRCQYPLCSADCEDSPAHQVECAVFASGGARARPEVEDYSKPASYLEAVTTLRVLGLQTSDPTRWERLMQMDASPDHWPGSQVATTFQHNVANFLRSVCQVEADEKLLHKIGGILVTNAFEARVRNAGTHVRCVFPEAALLPHSCLPNVHHTVDEQFNIFLRAANHIKQGETLFTSYTHCLTGTVARRDIISYSKFFDCGCERCADPTEFGTYFSALKCCGCNQGLILPRDSLDKSSEWQCDKCSYEVHPDNVRKLSRMLLHELDGLDATDFIDHEMFIRKYSNLLHPNHYLIFDAKHRLSQMYGRTSGYYIQHLTETHLKRKIELCRDVLAVATKNAPGISRLTGLTYYELHAPLMVLAQRMYDRGDISRTEIEARFEEAADNLRKAIGMLKYEPPNSLEGHINTAAIGNLQELEQLQQTAKHLPDSGRGHLTPEHIETMVGSFNAILELMDDCQWRV